MKLEWLTFTYLSLSEQLLGILETGSHAKRSLEEGQAEEVTPCRLSSLPEFLKPDDACIGGSRKKSRSIASSVSTALISRA